jgi:hypothetical protein
MGLSHEQFSQAYARCGAAGYEPAQKPPKIPRIRAPRLRPHRNPNPPATIDLVDAPWQGPPAFKQGEVAKRLGNGLQNRYTRVRIPSSPPQVVEDEGGCWAAVAGVPNRKQT